MVLGSIVVGSLKARHEICMTWCCWWFVIGMRVYTNQLAPSHLRETSVPLLWEVIFANIPHLLQKKYKYSHKHVRSWNLQVPESTYTWETLPHSWWELVSNCLRYNFLVPKRLWCTDTSEESVAIWADTQTPIRFQWLETSRFVKGFLIFHEYGKYLEC